MNMQAIIKPGAISGEVTIPPSKSMMQRACAAALLHTGTTIIRNAGTADDDKAALRVIQQLGAKVHTLPNNELEIISHGVQPVSDTIDCGESGLCARLFAPVAAISHLPVLINGRGSLLERPMETFKNIFEQLHVTLPGFNHRVPFTVKGPMQIHDIEIDGSMSSQFLSGLLFAFAFTTHEPVTIKVRELKSIPYINLTLSVLQHFGKEVTHDNYSTFYIKPSVDVVSRTVEIDIESDWSSAAYWLVAGAVGGNITLKGLNTSSLQADKEIVSVLEAAGANLRQDVNSITIEKSRLRGFEFDATHCPDLFPILAILASFCKGDSSITGLHRLWHKESNRAQSIAEMLLQFDVAFSIEDDTLCITGEGEVPGTYIDSYNDHRIAMAASIAASCAMGTTTIDNAEAVSKSYPGFFKDLQRLNIDCSFKE